MVTLTDALEILQWPTAGGPAFRIALACGFTPLHLRTFLEAALRVRLPSRPMEILDGHYGDPVRTIEAAASNAVHGVAVVLEWADLDARLGYRSSSAWGPDVVRDVIVSAGDALKRIEAALGQLPVACPVALSLPTLPLPPVFGPQSGQMSPEETALTMSALAFASRIGKRPGLSIVSTAQLVERSPVSGRRDAKTELLFDLPYSLSHTEAVAQSLAALLLADEPKKGLITNLDDTLWDGLAGEIGPQLVTWSLDGRSQIHGVYQRLLASFALEGVLIGVASKNTPETVDAVLARADLIVPASTLFPVEVSWGPKSVAVGRILARWNLTPDSVVFVDDSPLELAEAAAAHPGLETLQFPKGDDAAGYALMRRLRDLFGKTRRSEEDALRLPSLRAASDREAEAAVTSPEDFLRGIDAHLDFDFHVEVGDARALDLVNKTNQFNLNGVRHTAADWAARIHAPGAIAVTVSYRDRFGPLGKIAVLQGTRSDTALRVDTWVMSCRAFSRRIEYQCLKVLFERLSVAEIYFSIQPTARNGPIRDFLESVAASAGQVSLCLAKEQFDLKCPDLFHQVHVHEQESRR